jgi:hypothetical protein
LKPEAITAERFDQATLETGLLWTDDYSDLFGALSARIPRVSP